MTKKTQINPPLDTPLVQRSALVQKIHPKTDCRLISLLIPGLGFRRVALRHFWGGGRKDWQQAGQRRGKTTATVSKAKGGNRAGFCSPRVLVAIAEATELDCKLWRVSLLCIADFFSNSYFYIFQAPSCFVCITSQQCLYQYNLSCNHPCTPALHPTAVQLLAQMWLNNSTDGIVTH